MRIIWAIIGALAGFVVSDAAIAILAYLAMGAPSASEMQAKPAAAEILAFGPLVGLLGLGLGIWLALRLTRRARYPRRHRLRSSGRPRSFAGATSLQHS